jgi:hypothetical protein
LPVELPLALTPEFFADVQKVRQWKAFLNRAGLTVEVELAEVATFIAGFVMPPIEKVGEKFTRRWLAGGPWQ